MYSFVLFLTAHHFASHSHLFAFIFPAPVFIALFKDNVFDPSVQIAHAKITRFLQNPKSKVHPSNPKDSSADSWENQVTLSIYRLDSYTFANTTFSIWNFELASPGKNGFTLVVICTAIIGRFRIKYIIREITFVWEVQKRKKTIWDRPWAAPNMDK